MLTGFTAINVEVVVHDDNDRPEGDVTVSGDLIPPTGPSIPFSDTTRWAGGGEAEFDYEPGGDLDPGVWTFAVNSISKAGFVHETARDVETSDDGTVEDRNADPDGDGLSNGTGNCPGISNPGQEDADLDGVGDACDLCPAHYDELQVDDDGDGVGNRCTARRSSRPRPRSEWCSTPDSPARRCSSGPR